MTLLLTSDAAFAQDPKYEGKNKGQFATSILLSVAYRQVGFKLSLVASDQVVRAYNRLMQYFYHFDERSSPEEKAAGLVKALGDLLLEIRKSMGNEATKLDRWEMIEWFTSDAERLKQLSQTMK